MSPPMTGPMIGPRTNGTPMMLMTRPMRCGPAARAKIDWPTGSSMPPPMPWITRKAMSELAHEATPHRREPMMKRVSEVIQTNLAPKRSTAHPVTGMTMDSASRYPVATHWMVVTETWKSRPRVARATATMVVSRIDMIDPRTTTLEVRRSAGDSVNEGAAGEVIGLLHITQRYGVVKDFPRWENRSVGVSEDA